jgi:hypothetical protein
LDEKCPPSTLHAFLVALWGFLTLQGKTSKLGFDLDSIICLGPKKNIKLSKLVFSFVPSYTKQKKFNNEVFKIFL